MPVEPAGKNEAQDPPSPPPRSWGRRFAAALGAYAALALMAGLTLDGLLRTAVWALVGALAVKTWLAWRRLR